jgi:hypothetical protein
VGMIDLRGKYSVDEDMVQRVLDQETPHAYYDITVNRSKVMNSWYQSEYDEFLVPDRNIFSDKSYIIKQSSIESNDEYQEKLERMRLFPLEAKFLSAQQRIYDENNVNRTYSDDTAPFWLYKEMHYDDSGAGITEFYRDKALFVKEVLGFGAVITDLMMDDNGNAITDRNGNIVPYTYVIRPHELYNFDYKYGQLILLITKQRYWTVDKKQMTKWCVYTPDRIRVYKQEGVMGVGTKELIKDIPNPFGRVPATILRGATDANTSFVVGKPRRYSLKGLYLAASELFYDLQKGSELFAHPIPVYSEDIVKALSGLDQDGKYNSTDIKESVGLCIIYPNDVEVPNTLFHQASMQGLQHLRDVVFKDLMSLIFLLASVRDKSVVKSNVSGDAKRFDNVEEQGLLAQTAMDMEEVENDQLKLQAEVRGEDPDEFFVNYSKHYDLSSADEIWNDLTEGAQYGILNHGLYKYQVHEYLRKRSAPTDIKEQVMNEINELGMPTQASELSALRGIIDDVRLRVKAQPELLSSEGMEALMNNMDDIETSIDNEEQ